MGQALGKDSIKCPPSSNRCPAKAPQASRTWEMPWGPWTKPFIWTFTWGTNSALLYALSSSKSEKPGAPAALCRQHGLSMAEHCLELPFLGAVMVSGTSHATQGACRSQTPASVPVRKWHETSGYLEGLVDSRVPGYDKDGKCSLRRVILSMVFSSRVDTYVRKLPRLSSSSPSYQFCYEQLTVIITFNEGLEEAAKWIFLSLY